MEKISQALFTVRYRVGSVCPYSLHLSKDVHVYYQLCSDTEAACMAVFGSWNRRIIFLRGFIFRSLRISSPLGFIKAFTPACVLIAAHLIGCSSEAGLCRA